MTSESELKYNYFINGLISKIKVLCESQNLRLLEKKRKLLVKSRDVSTSNPRLHLQWISE